MSATIKREGSKYVIQSTILESSGLIERNYSEEEIFLIIKLYKQCAFFADTLTNNPINFEVSGDVKDFISEYPNDKLTYVKWDHGGSTDENKYY